MRLLTGLPALILTGLVLLSCGEPSDNAAPALETARPPGVLIVSFSTDSADTFGPPVADSIIALEWLRLYCDSVGYDLSTMEYVFGELVVGIGQRGRRDEGSWLYQINGEMAMQAVNKQLVARTDTLTFFHK